MVLGEGFDDMLGCPRGGRMIRDIEMHDSAPFVPQDQELIEHAVTVGAVKKSTAAIWPTWFCRKVLQVCEGGLG